MPRNCVNTIYHISQEIINIFSNNFSIPELACPTDTASQTNTPTRIRKWNWCTKPILNFVHIPMVHISSPKGYLNELTTCTTKPYAWVVQGKINLHWGPMTKWSWNSYEGPNHVSTALDTATSPIHATITPCIYYTHPFSPEDHNARITFQSVDWKLPLAQSQSNLQSLGLPVELLGTSQLNWWWSQEVDLNPKPLDQLKVFSRSTDTPNFHSTYWKC